MKKFLLLLLISQSALCQVYDYIEIGDTLQKPKYVEFVYLNDSTDISKSVMVAKIVAAGSLEDPTRLLDIIRNRAQALGANSYKFTSFSKPTPGNGELVLTAFFTPDSILRTNFDNIDKNKIYVFGDGNLLSDKIQRYKVDGEKFEVAAGHYRVHNLPPGTELKLSKGGFTGMTIWFSGEHGRPSEFLTLGGLGVAGGGYAVSSAGSGVGVNFNTGKIEKMDPNTALLLLKMFEQQK